MLGLSLSRSSACRRARREAVSRAAGEIRRSVSRFLGEVDRANARVRRDENLEDVLYQLDILKASVLTELLTIVESVDSVDTASHEQSSPRPGTMIHDTLESLTEVHALAATTMVKIERRVSAHQPGAPSVDARVPEIQHAAMLAIRAVASRGVRHIQTN
jgi:hypothetical protein